MDGSAEAAQCGRHPDRYAMGACERCGDFICAACRVEGAQPITCRACLEHLDRGPHLRYARVLSVVMMAHGALLAATGAYYVLFGGILFGELSGLSDPATAELPYFGEGMSVLIVLMGGATAAPGVLQAIAGWQLFRMRQLSFGWVALFAGLVSLFGCYCFPTSVVLASVGAWVLSRDDVKARFRVRVPPATAAS